jgi:AraC-like DNA-binding protein
MRKTHATRNDIAKMDIHDISLEEQLSKIASKAVKEEKRKAPAKVSLQSKFPVDDSRSVSEKLDNEIRVKLERIGVNARLTPDDVVQQSTLTRPQQAEIDAYNKTLKSSALKSGALQTQIPALHHIPKSDEDWKDGYGLSLDSLQGQIPILTHILRQRGTQIEEANKLLKRNLSEANRRNVEERRNKYEQEVNAYDFQLRVVERRIVQIKAERLKIMQDLKQQNAELMNQFSDQIGVLQNVGLSLHRFSNESDEDYQQRIAQSVDALQQDEQLQDRSMYITQEFIKSMRTLNLPLVVVDSIANSIGDDVKEYLLSIWSYFHKEFLKMFGENPYRLNDHIQPLLDMISSIYHEKHLKGSNHRTPVKHTPLRAESVGKPHELTFAIPENLDLQKKRVAYEKYRSKLESEGFTIETD